MLFSSTVLAELMWYQMYSLVYVRLKKNDMIPHEKASGNKLVDLNNNKIGPHLGDITVYINFLCLFHGLLHVCMYVFVRVIHGMDCYQEDREHSIVMA